MIHTRKFGKKPVRFDSRTLQFRDYVGLPLPVPPARVDWSRGFAINWGMALNGPNNYGNGVPSDGIGCCTESKKCNAVQIWTLDNGRMVTVPDSVVLQAYEVDAGYVPGNAATDGGESVIDNLNDWRRNGFGGVELAAYASVDPSNWLHIQQSIFLFGGLDMGFSVPQSAIDQNVLGQPWTVVSSNSGIVGGHDVIVHGFDAASQMLMCITWGMQQLMSWEFFTTYCDECYCLLSPTWLGKNAVSPSKFNMAALMADLVAVIG